MKILKLFYDNVDVVVVVVQHNYKRDAPTMYCTILLLFPYFIQVLVIEWLIQNGYRKVTIHFVLMPAGVRLIWGL